jgi:hypothetical protein
LFVRSLSLCLIAALLMAPAMTALAQSAPPPPIVGPGGTAQPVQNPQPTSPVIVTPPTTAAQPAHAGRQHVLILRTEGATAGDAARMAATKELHQQALRYKSLDVALSNADLVEEMFEFECTEAGVDCLGRVGHKYGASLVVFSELSKTPDGHDALTLRLIDSTTARVAQISQQPLESLDKFQAAVTKGLIVLFGPADLAYSDVEVPGTLFVQLFAGGVALVYVDDKLAGRTATGRPPAGGLRATVPAGVHTVRIVKAGFRDWTGRVTVPPNGTVEQTIALEQVAVVSPGDDKDKVSTPITKKWWFWTAIGAVVVTGAAVGIYYATKSTPTQTGAITLSLDHVDAATDPIFSGKGGGK